MYTPFLVHVSWTVVYVLRHFTCTWVVNILLMLVGSFLVC